MVVKILTTSEKLYEGNVYSITSYNKVGQFDVLSQHANFISLIEREVVLNKGRTDEMKYVIKKGVMIVNSDKVEIYF